MSGPGARILVVDDERFFREAIREILVGEGYEATLVADGESALDAAADPAIGVVVLDIRLPGIDGIQVLRRLRELRPELRVIMLSASTDQELVLEALRLGACDYLAKPLHDEELLLAVHRAVESYAVAAEWGRLRGRLDRLVSGAEALAGRVRAAQGEERRRLLHSGAAELAALALEAQKTSLMLLDESGRELRVVASCGRDITAERMDAVAVGEGVAGLALARSEPLVVNVVDEDQRFQGRVPTGRYRSGAFAVIPLVAGGRAFGVLCVTDRHGDPSFDAEDLSLLRLLAMQVAALMAEEPAAASTPARADPDATLLQVSAPAPPPELDSDAELARLVCDAVVSETLPERVIRAALRPLAAALPAEPVSLYLVDGASGELRLEGEWDGGQRADRAVLPKERGLTGTVLQTGRLVATARPQEDPRFDPASDTPEDGRPGALLCVPLRLRSKTVGVARAFLADGARVSARTGEVLGAALSAAVRSVLLYRSLVESIEEVAEVRRQAQQAQEGGGLQPPRA
jgi:DNA-binding response OmpR family regulator